MENLCFVFYFFFLTHQIFPISANTLIPPESLKDGENLTSQSEVFELGFFSPPNSRNRYLGIWFKNIPLQTVVWVANRDTPLIDSKGIFMISSTGNLVILNETNQTIWSTNLSKVGEKPIMELLESGNLVLRDNTSDECLWQSFDHPSDTMLPYMKIGWDLSIGLNSYLTSWKSTDDPSLGDYTYGIDHTPYPEPVLRNGANKTYRSGPWNGLRNSGQPELTNSITFIYQVDGNEIEASYFSFKHNQQPDVHSMAVLRQNGNHGEMQRLTWVVNKSQNWQLQYPIPRDRCDEYGRCGVGSTCDINEVPGCHCLEGFKPASLADWNDMDWSRGCVRKIPLDCAKGDGFLKLTEVKVPDTTRTWMNMNISLDECRVKCLKNCSCTAYANTDIRGNGNGCVMWFGDLIDIRNLLGAGQDLYIRVAASELGDAPSKAKAGPKSKKRIKTMVVMISVIASTVLLALGIYVLWRKKKTESITRESSDERDHTGQVQDPSFDQVFIHGKKELSGEKNDNLELNMFDMDAIEKATNNFSNKNMLGQGGFGCVYKGTLGDGQQIAVKRLSKNSGQGVDEFKNEVILIAKLQHRNLVRLLGYCVEWEEKILVYEYMENKGLDEILFTKANKITLDWPKRFNIIVGISRGLLYLHQDSRFRIIHRDLKPSNVLLDGELIPKISDFGMARIFGGDDSEAKTKRVVGTYGYMSPEYAMDGLFSVKSDVFSFGVLVLEIVSGRKNKGFFISSDSEHNLLGYAWTLWKEGHVLDLIDETVTDSCLENEAVRCIHIGLLCVQEHAEDRPTMSSVVLMLSTDTALQQPRQPGFCFGKSRISTGSTSNNRESHSVNVVTVTNLEAR